MVVTLTRPAVRSGAGESLSHRNNGITYVLGWGDAGLPASSHSVDAMGVPRRLDVLTSPLFALSILLLITNDHVLKEAWPGLVTGKLSDIAGVVMIAIALTACLGHAGAAVTATAVSFGLLKTVPSVAAWSAPVLGGVTLTDPYDLLALLVLVPVWRWLRSRHLVRNEDQLRRGWALRIALITAAVFATSATSCDTEGVSAIYVLDGVLLAAASDGEYISTDGGTTWQDWPDDVSIPWGSNVRQTEACAESVCFRADELTGRLTQSVPASETPVLELDESQEVKLAKLGNPQCASQAFATIAAITPAYGQNVVVSMGPAGALHRGPDGAWRWVRIGRWGVPDDAGESYFGIPVSQPD